MVDLLARIAIAVAVIAVTQYQFGAGFTKDSQALQSKPRPSPFHLRWLLPTICGQSRMAWSAATWGGLVAASVLFPGDLWALALFACSPWYRFIATVPVTTDGAALAFALSATRDSGWFAVPIALAGGAVAERVPVWQALYTLRPEYAYVGLCAVLVAWKWISSVPRDGESAVATGRARAVRLSNIEMLVLSWGAGGAALLAPWSVHEAVIVAVAYGQMLLAWDTVRMIGWAAPVIYPKAVSIIPARFLPAAVVLSWFNPWGASRKRGVVVC